MMECFELEENYLTAEVFIGLWSEDKIMRGRKIVTTKEKDQVLRDAYRNTEV